MPRPHPPLPETCPPPAVGEVNGRPSRRAGGRAGGTAMADGGGPTGADAKRRRVSPDEAAAEAVPAQVLACSRQSLLRPSAAAVSGAAGAVRVCGRASAGRARALPRVQGRAGAGRPPDRPADKGPAAAAVGESSVIRSAAPPSNLQQVFQRGWKGVVSKMTELSPTALGSSRPGHRWLKARQWARSGGS